MLNMVLVFGVTLLLVLMNGCDSGNSNSPVLDDSYSPGDAEYSGYIVGSHTNTSFIVEGVEIGSNEVPNDDLRTTIPVTITVDEPEFIVGQGYKLKEQLGDNAWYFLVSIENIGLTTYCGVVFGSVSIFDASDVLVAFSENMPSSFFVGSMRYAPTSGNYVSTCLAPGEKGYFAREYEIPIDTAVRVEVGSIHRRSVDIVNSEPYEPVSDDVEPIGYRIYPYSQFSQAIDVNFENTGSNTSRFNDIEYILLDNNNEPLYYSWFGFVNRYAFINPGETLPLIDHSRFQGSANKILVFMKYLEINI